MINPAAKIIKLNAELAEKIDKIRTREALQFAAGFDAELFQFSFRFLTDSPDFADGEFLDEGRHVFRRDLELAVWLVYFTGDFCDELVRADSG